MGNLNFFKKNKEKGEGFTLLETLVAIFIFTLAITGPLAFSQSSLRTAFLARDQVTAFFLAQDVIEQIKNSRDSRMTRLVSGTDGGFTYFYTRGEWLDEFAGCISLEGAHKECTVDTDLTQNNTDRVKTCSSSDPEPGCYMGSNAKNPLRYNPASNTYTTETDGTQETVFYRNVIIEPIGASAAEAEEAKVTVKIVWQTHPNLPMRTIEVVEYIKNWIPRQDATGS